MRKTPIVVSLDKVRLQTDRLIVVSDGFRVLAKGGVGNTPIIIGDGIVGPQSDCIIFERLFNCDGQVVITGRLRQFRCGL